MGEILKIIFGDYTFIQLFGFFWFLMIGYIIYGLNESNGRNVQSSNTPIKWNWKFWFYDNWRRYLATILTTYVFFRFYIEFVGHPLTNFETLMIGLIGDGIGASLKAKVKAISADRKKLMEEYTVDEAATVVKTEAKSVAVDVKAEAATVAEDVKTEAKLVAADVVATAADVKEEFKG
jgi:hypothetical protein